MSPVFHDIRNSQRDAACAMLFAMTDQELRKRIERVVREWAAAKPPRTFKELVDALAKVAKEAQDSATPTEWILHL